MAEVRISVFKNKLESVKFPDSSFVLNSQNGGNANVEEINIPQENAGSAITVGAVNAGYYDDANHLATASSVDGVIIVNDKRTYGNIIFRPENATVLEKLQEVELSYNKIAAIATQTAGNLKKAQADYAAIQWSPDLQKYIIPTTGITSKGEVKTRSLALNIGSKGGYSGNVNRFQYQDLENILKELKRQNIDDGNWFALPDPEIWIDLLSIPEVRDYEKMGRQDMLRNGVIGSFGKLMFKDPRHNEALEANIAYDLTDPSSPTIVEWGAALNENCVPGMLIWNDKYVERNEGTMEFFSRKQDPTYMGDVYNWGVRFGADKLRDDNRGVLAVYMKPNESAGVVG